MSYLNFDAQIILARSVPALSRGWAELTHFQGNGDKAGAGLATVFAAALI